MTPDRAPLKPTLFLDRDGTLTRDLGYTYKVDDLVWLDGARETIKAAKDAGALVIVVTNQSGIGRGYFTEADMHAFHAAMQRDLAQIGAAIDAFYFCPFIDGAVDPVYRVADHQDRKPNPGMLLRAINEWPVDRARSLMVGDQASDATAAERAGVAFAKADGRSLIDVVGGFFARQAPLS